MRMPLTGHLDELRSSIIRVIVAFFIAVIVTYSFSEPIVAFLEKPLLGVLPEGETHLYFTGLADKFLVYIRVSILAAFTLISPLILFEVWKFISPALYKHEKRLAIPFIFFGSFSFVLGLAFAYYVLIPYSYQFLINFGSENDKAIITLTEYFKLTVKFLLSMGLVFELPVALIILGMLGVIEADMLSRNRRYAIALIAVASAFITPPDVFTMVIVMGPLWLLYEASILGVRLVAKKSAVDSG